MNEKIRELAKNVDAVFDVVAMGRHDGVLFTETELEEFAKLIQKQCARIAISYIHSNSFESHDDLSNYERGCDDTAALISSRINNMFRSS